MKNVRKFLAFFRLRYWKTIILLEGRWEQIPDLFSASKKAMSIRLEYLDLMNGFPMQANVISRHEEVASTRSLLNTTKLMEDNATLYKLKELEYLEKICDKVGYISVGNENLLGQLSELLNNK